MQHFTMPFGRLLLLVTIVLQFAADRVESEWTFVPKVQTVWMYNRTDVAIFCKVYGSGTAGNLLFKLKNSTILNQFKHDWVHDVKQIDEQTPQDYDYRSLAYWILESNPELDGVEVTVEAFENLQPINESLNCNYTLRYITQPTDVADPRTNATDVTADLTDHANDQTSHVWIMSTVFCLLSRW